jgi:APA family basic amino acid/polyamine antiporter
LTGHAAAANAGPAIMLSFILGGIVCAFAGLCYAEMASTVPIAGSAYTYAYATMGEFLAWIIGWDLVLEYALGATTVAIGWSGYVVSFFEKNLGIHLPAQLVNAPYACDGSMDEHRSLSQHSGDADYFGCDDSFDRRHRGICEGEQCHRYH